MIQIIPTVLATSEDQYKKDISRFAEIQALKGGWVHLDFMDNKFVPNQGIDPLITAKYDIPFQKEAHLMVQKPRDYIEKLVKAGFKRVFFHLESQDNIDDCIKLAKKYRLEVGIVLNHETPLEKLEPFVSKIDAVLLMGVIPGFQGQPFIEGVVDKVKELKATKWPVLIGVDGAVRNNNIKSLYEAGADFVIVGSYLLKGNIDENLEVLWEALQEK